MKRPTKEKSGKYKISDNNFAVVHLMDNDKFKVSIWPDIELEQGEKYRISTKDDKSFDFDTFDEVKAYLLEVADEAYRDQFQ